MGLYGEEIPNLEQAIHAARIQVMNKVNDPQRRTLSLRIDDGGAGRTIRYVPGISVSVLRAKSGNYELSHTEYGTAQKLQGIRYDVEPVVKGAVLPVHSHHDTGSGLGRAGWSSLDRELKMVERMDESKPGWWHRGTRSKDGKFIEGKPQYDDGSRRSSNGKGDPGGGGSGADRGGTAGGSGGPSARDIDMAHQALGVPSLGAESVNFAPGKP